jgi:hypothetical protein
MMKNAISRFVPITCIAKWPEEPEQGFPQPIASFHYTASAAISIERRSRPRTILACANGGET